MIKAFLQTTLAAGIVFSMASAALAMTVVPISATASSAFPTYEAPNAIDANSLSDWASLGEGAGSTILFDLGGSFVLTGAAITDRVTSGGANNGFVGGTFDFTTQYELTFYSDAAGAFSVGTYTSPVIAVPAGTTGPEDFLTSPIFAAVTAASVRYTVVATQGENPGLSNISFQANVPEAATWAMLITGFGLVGAAARRRRSGVFLA